MGKKIIKFYAKKIFLIWTYDVVCRFSGEITEDTIRRYLMRKPMTAKELVQKFKSKLPQMTKEQMTQKIGQLLKRINPDRKYVNNILYLSVKKKD